MVRFVIAFSIFKIIQKGIDLKKIAHFMLFVALISNTYASVRTDLKDRDPKAVYEKSCRLAKTFPYSNVTGTIILRGKNIAYIGSAVGVSKNYIITAGHNMEYAHLAEEIFFTTQPRYKLGMDLQKNKNSHVSEVFLLKINPGYKKRMPPEPSPIKFKDNVCYLDGEPIQQINNKTFEVTFKKNQKYTNGVDLCVLKLKIPFPEKYRFPKFLSKGGALDNTLALSIGSGPMKYNWKIGAKFIHSKEFPPHEKHGVSCRVTEKKIGNYHFLHGSYKALMYQPDDSFIASDEMLKTEGLPVQGDSGGPLFIKVKDQYFLAGLLERTLSPIEGVTNNEEAHIVFGEHKKPVYPTWIDLRYHKNWIDSVCKK